MTSEERSLEITSIKGELIMNTAKEVPRFGLVRMLGASSYPGGSRTCSLCSAVGENA